MLVGSSHEDQAGFKTASPGSWCVTAIMGFFKIRARIVMAATTVRDEARGPSARAKKDFPRKVAGDIRQPDGKR
jgi:hypothetical protein